MFFAFRNQQTYAIEEKKKRFNPISFVPKVPWVIECDITSGFLFTLRTR